MGRPLLATGRTLIDVVVGELIIIVNNEQVAFNIFKDIEYLEWVDSCVLVCVVQGTITEVYEKNPLSNSLDILTPKDIEEEGE